MGDVRRTMDVLVTSSTLLPVFKEKKRKEDVVNTVDGGRRGAQRRVCDKERSTGNTVVQSTKKIITKSTLNCNDHYCPPALVVPYTPHSPNR